MRGIFPYYLGLEFQAGNGESKHFPVQATDFQTLKYSTASFDAAVLVDALEHVADIGLALDGGLGHGLFPAGPGAAPTALPRSTPRRTRTGSREGVSPSPAWGRGRSNSKLADALNMLRKKYAAQSFQIVTGRGEGNLFGSII